MGKIALGLKINLSKIDMARVFNGKDGAQYLDMTIFVNMDELDQYGNSGMITQDVSKEEKAQKVQGNILGNGNVFWVENGQAPQKAGAPQQQGGFVPKQAPAPQQQQGGYNQASQQQQPPQQQGFAPQQQSAPQSGFAPQGGYSNDQKAPF